MRIPLALFAAATLLPGPAFAQSSVVERLLALSREANLECQRAQLPEPALAAACQSARSYDQALAGRGFCFDNAMNEWTSCALANRNRPPATAPEPQDNARQDDAQGEQDEPLPPPQASGPQEPDPQAAEPPRSGESYEIPQDGTQENEAQSPPQEEPDLAPVAPPQAENAPPPPPEEVPLEPSDSGWRSYANGRFGTHVDVPPGFEPRTSVDNGDGQTFASPDGNSEVAVYGSTLEGQSLQQYRDWYRSELSGKSYEAGGANWFVISGTAEGKIYYVKVVRTAHCGVPVVHHMVFRYPVAQKRRYDNVVERLGESLRGTAQSSVCQG